MNNIKVTLRSLFVHNLGLKFLALILAALTWFYVVGELNKVTLIEENAPLSAYYPYKLKAKQLPILPLFVGTAPTGHRVDERNIEISPKNCLVLGPSNIIERLDYVQTRPIDISEYTKSFKVKMGLHPVANLKLPEEDFITVIVPIAKKPEEEEQP